MALEKLLLLCAASLAFFDSEGVAKAETNPTLTLNSARNCLANMNAARKKAGLVALTEVTEKIKKEDDFQANSFEKALCDALLKGEKFMLGEDKLSAGTYAFYELTESADKDENDKIPDSVCSAAVKKWQGGFSLFGQNSPVKENFTTTDAFSFLTLYNPSSVPEGECKVAICDGTQGGSMGADSEGFLQLGFRRSAICSRLRCRIGRHVIVLTLLFLCDAAELSRRLKYFLELSYTARPRAPAGLFRALDALEPTGEPANFCQGIHRITECLFKPITDKATTLSLSHCRWIIELAAAAPLVYINFHWRSMTQHMQNMLLEPLIVNMRLCSTCSAFVMPPHCHLSSLRVLMRLSAEEEEGQSTEAPFLIESPI
ncbi:hypothetical protein Esti_001969 [Eimeria stiedai]